MMAASVSIVGLLIVVSLTLLLDVEIRRLAGSALHVDRQEWPSQRRVRGALTHVGPSTLFRNSYRSRRRAMVSTSHWSAACSPAGRPLDRGQRAQRPGGTPRRAL